MKIYCVSSATENIMMEVSLKLPNFRFSVALAYNGISIIIFSKAPDIECILNYFHRHFLDCSLEILLCSTLGIALHSTAFLYCSTLGIVCIILTSSWPVLLPLGGQGLSDYGLCVDGLLNSVWSACLILAIVRMHLSDTGNSLHSLSVVPASWRRDRSLTTFEGRAIGNWKCDGGSPVPCSLLPAPCSLLPNFCSLLPATCSLIPAPFLPCSLLCSLFCLLPCYLLFSPFHPLCYLFSASPCPILCCICHFSFVFTLQRIFRRLQVIKSSFQHRRMSNATPPASKDLFSTVPCNSDWQWTVELLAIRLGAPLSVRIARSSWKHRLCWPVVWHLSHTLW